MARPMNMPPSRKNSVGLPNGASTTRTGVDRAEASGGTGTAPTTTASATPSRPVAGMGIGSVSHQMITNSSTPASRWASGVISPRGTSTSHATIAAGPSTSPKRSQGTRSHSGSPDSGAGELTG